MSIGIRSRQKVYPALRFVVVLSATATALLGAGLVLVSGLSNPSTGYSYDRMQFASASVYQESHSVYRGSVNQPVIHIVVAVTGQGSSLFMQSLSFSAGGTSTPIPTHVENARLFFTGGEREFNTRIQCGATRPVVTADEMIMVANQPLNEGLNHFWLTFDIPANASPNARVDAECNYVEVDAKKYLPLAAAPAGSLRIDGSTPFFSTGILDAGQANAWNSRRDGSGINPAHKNARNVYFIQNGHKMDCSLPASFHVLVVEKGGLLRVNSEIDAAKIVVGEDGVLRNDHGTGKGVATLEMKNGSVLIHNHEGALMGMNHLLAPRSTVCFYRIPEDPVPERITWGNVILFVRSMRGVDLYGRFEVVKGDFEIRKTGSGGFVYYSNTSSLSVGGSLVVSGGSFRGIENGVLEVDVQEALVVKDGYLSDAVGLSGSTVLRIGGDVNLKGGQFHFCKGKQGGSLIKITGSSSPRVTWSTGTCDVLLGNTVVDEGKELHLNGGKLGEVVKRCTVTVSAGAALYCGTYPVTGPGGFVLSDDATLGIGSINGIHSESGEGNILTADRQFSSEATYVYHTGASPQQTGVFNTVPAVNSVKTIILQKDNPSDEVVVSANLSVQSGPWVRKGTLREDRFTIKSAARLRSEAGRAGR